MPVELCDLAVRLQTGRGGVITPHRRGWDLGVGWVISNMHNHAILCQAAEGAELDFQDDSKFWGSAYGRMLDANCKQALSARKDYMAAAAYSIGALTGSLEAMAHVLARCCELFCCSLACLQPLALCMHCAAYYILRTTSHLW